MKLPRDAKVVDVADFGKLEPHEVLDDAPGGVFTTRLASGKLALAYAADEHGTVVDYLLCEILDEEVAQLRTGLLTPRALLDSRPLWLLARDDAKNAIEAWRVDVAAIPAEHLPNPAATLADPTAHLPARTESTMPKSAPRQPAEPAIPFWKSLYNVWFPEFLGLGLGRLVLILKSPQGIAYGVVVVFCLGGFGTWLSLILYKGHLVRAQDLSLSILTYSVAIVGTSIMDAFWGQEKVKAIRILTVILGVVALLPAASATLRFFGPGATGTFDPFANGPWGATITYVVLPIVCWLFANVADDKFKNDPEAAVGGSPLKPLT